MKKGRSQDKILMKICEENENIDTLSLDWVLDQLK
jgi:hypothetical protein